MNNASVYRQCSVSKITHNMSRCLNDKHVYYKTTLKLATEFLKIMPHWMYHELNEGNHNKDAVIQITAV